MKKYNLCDTPFITGFDTKGNYQTYTLKEAFEKANEISILYCESKVHMLAIRQFLSAIVARAYEGILQTEDDWYDIFEEGQFDIDRINNYLDKWYDRFWLVNTEGTPFMQLAEGDERIIKNKDNGCFGSKRTVNQLLTILDISDNKPKLYTPVRQELTIAEGIQCLISYQACANMAVYQGHKEIKYPAKNSESIGRIAQGLNYQLVGRNLFETILMNIPMTDQTIGKYKYASWERLEDFDKLDPDLALLWTYPYKRMYLLFNEDYTAITGCIISFKTFHVHSKASFYIDPHKGFCRDGKTQSWKLNKDGDRDLYRGNSNEGVFASLTEGLLYKVSDSASDEDYPYWIGKDWAQFIQSEGYSFGIEVIDARLDDKNVKFTDMTSGVITIPKDFFEKGSQYNELLCKRTSLCIENCKKMVQEVTNKTDISRRMYSQVGKSILNIINEDEENDFETIQRNLDSYLKMVIKETDNWCMNELRKKPIEKQKKILKREEKKKIVGYLIQLRKAYACLKN